MLNKLPVPFRKKRILIVRLDAIGDYILFRNGLHFIKHSERFRGYKISLLGNVLWKDLAETFDKNTVDKFYWIHPSALNTPPVNTIKSILLFARLKFQGFSVVVNPVHSRILNIDEFIYSLAIPTRIASSGDGCNYRTDQKQIADNLYTELIPVPGVSIFEYFRNAALVSGLSGITPSEMKLRIDVDVPATNDTIFVISPGAGHNYRRWPATDFAKLINMLGSVYPKAFFYICGSAADSEAAELILDNTSDYNVIDRCGNLTLVQFAVLLKQAALLIANESSAIHLAAAINTPGVCISNGNMFGRFNPYPPEMNTKIHTIYSDSTFTDKALFDFNVSRTSPRSEFDISKLQPQPVFDLCIEVLKATNK